MENNNLVRIIPKERPEEPEYVKIAFIVSLIIFFVVTIAGIVLLLSLNKMKTEKVALGRKLATFEEKKLERDLQLKAEKINTFSSVFKSHLVPTRFLDFLKKFCHEKVQFIGMNLSLDDGYVELSGLADNYLALSQQILIFKKAEYVNALRVSDVNLTQGGKVSFHIYLNFSKSLINQNVQ